MSKLIVVDNIKKGTGKTTLSVHIAMDLVLNGKKVVILYWREFADNLKCFSAMREKLGLKCFDAIALPYNMHSESSMKNLFLQYKNQYDYVLVDIYDYSKVIFLYYLADVIITPVSDSILDLHSLCELGDGDSQYLPSRYTSEIWKQRIKKFKETMVSLNWIIVLNRYMLGKSNNRDNIEKHIKNITQKFGAKYIKGISNRSIYQSLFMNGKTVFDMKQAGYNIARQEVDRLVNCIK